MSLKEFKKNVLPFKDKLYRFALSILGNPMEAEDVAQEILIKIWNRRSDLSRVDNLEAWSMRLTKNLSIDKLRSKHRRTDELDHYFDLSDQKADPHRLAEINDSFSRIKKLMASLPENQRMVMQLRDIEDLSYQEISKVLDMPLSQVKINLFRARKLIRAKVLKSESYGL